MRAGEEVTTGPSSERLTYRLVSSEDVGRLQELCADGRLQECFVHDEAIDHAWAHDRVAESAALMADQGVGLYLVEREGQAVGLGGFRRLPTMTAEPQIVHAVAADHLEGGYAAEMGEALIAKAWAVGWSRVVTASPTGEVASRRALPQLGFVGAGRLPAASDEVRLYERHHDAPPDPVLQSGDTASLAVASTWDGRSCGEADAVTLHLRADDEAVVVSVEAPFHDDPPPSAPVGSTPRLWEHEVVEVMWLGDDERYLEVELSPHGHFLVLVLHGVRHVVHQGLVPFYEATIDGDRWRGRARIPRLWLPPGCDRLNAFAIAGRGSQRRHLAWRPTGGERPDFHRLEAFGRWRDVATNRPAPQPKI